MRIGLISDTHMPQRWTALPDSLSEIFAHVDIILHAGDVGELWVLDQLSAFAPAIAVHGNDDTIDAHRELPEQQIIAMANRRIHLWHSHYPDRAEELASRKDDALLPKLKSIAHRARRSGATLAVFGHWHIPLVIAIDDVTLINPGAIASGNEVTRQVIQTVAVLDITAVGDFTVTHYDVKQPESAFDPAFAPDNGFRRTAQAYSASILSPALHGAYSRLRSELTGANRDFMLSIVLDLARDVWSGRQQVIGIADVRAKLAGCTDAPDELRIRVTELLDSIS